MKILTPLKFSYTAVIRRDDCLLPEVHCYDPVWCVWAYDCMTVWLYDCMTVWLYDCMTVWPYDRMTVWLYDRMTVWLYDRMTVWLYDRMTVWPYDRMTVWLGMKHVIAEFNNNFFEKTKYKFYIHWKYEDITYS